MAQELLLGLYIHITIKTDCLLCDMYGYYLPTN